MATIEPPTAFAVGTPAGRAAATRAVVLAQRLLALDDVWTIQLEAAREGDVTARGDVHTAASVVDEMRAGLRDLQGAAETVELMLRDAGGELVEEGLAILEAQPAAPPDLAERFARALPDFTLWSASMEACQYLRDELATEEQLLSGKLDALYRGEVPEGDFRFPFRCALHLMLAGGTVVATIGLGGAPAFVLIGAACASGQALMGWESAGCPNVLPAISRGRR